MNPLNALNQLQANPDHFFRYYPIRIAGASAPWVPGAASLKPFYLAKKGAGHAGQIGGQVRKEGHYGATRPGFLHTKEISSFFLQEGVMPNSTGPFQTLGVPMVNYNSMLYGCPNLAGNIGAMPHYVVDHSANLMTTGQLSGCTFAWITQGADLWCIHVQPKDGIVGTVLHTQLDVNGHFAAAAGVPLQTFGPNDYHGARATVIGVRHAGAWRLYAQTSIDMFSTISGAWRLHPGPVVAL